MTDAGEPRRLASDGGDTAGLSLPARSPYRIRIRGRLSDRFVDAFRGMRLTACWITAAAAGDQTFVRLLDTSDAPLRRLAAALMGDGSAEQLVAEARRAALPRAGRAGASAMAPRGRGRAASWWRSAGHAAPSSMLGHLALPASERTASSPVTIRKLGVTGRNEAVARAWQLGLA